MTRWVDAHLRDEMDRRVHPQPGVMQQRKQLVEHPFGTMQRWKDAGYFLRRGLANVHAEWSLTVLAYNLKRVFTMVGVPKLLAALR